jgi:HEAT repeat protein
VLPGQGKSEPSKFSDAPIPAPLRTAIRDSVDALLRRIVADGPEYQRADAIKLLAELKPETAIQSAAALENPAHRAAVQGKLALQVEVPLRQQLFDMAIESARSVASAEERGIALLEVAGQLHRTGDKAGPAKLANEAVSLLQPRQAEGPARQLRLAAAVR